MRGVNPFQSFAKKISKKYGWKKVYNSELSHLRVRGVDPDGDRLTFGVTGPDAQLVRLEQQGDNQVLDQGQDVNVQLVRIDILLNMSVYKGMRHSGVKLWPGILTKSVYQCVRCCIWISQYLPSFGGVENVRSWSRS